jgi:D-threonate/D-erythronate kinase
MKCLRILADDLTGALDCAAAFGAGVPVHLGQPASAGTNDIDIVATATRDVPVVELPALLKHSLAWLRGADVAFKKVDSLLRGNTFDEVDWLARHAPFRGLALVPAFPAQHRVTEGGQQWWQQADGARAPIAASIRESLQTRGWRVCTGPTPPQVQQDLVAWVPDVLDNTDLDRVAAFVLQTGTPWLWCGSAGLAHALRRQLPARTQAASVAPAGGRVMLVSASHHAVTREQWRVLRAARGSDCLAGEDPRSLQTRVEHYPALMDLSATHHLSPEQATALLHTQAQAIATHAPRPRTLVVVGGDTLLALCQALGATALRSQVALDRPGWGCARMVGGRWDGLVCHTRSGAFGGPQDLLEVLASV